MAPGLDGALSQEAGIEQGQGIVCCLKSVELSARSLPGEEWWPGGAR